MSDIYSATKGTFSSFNEVETNKDELSKKYIQFIEDEKYGYQQISSRQFNEIANLRLGNKLTNLEIHRKLKSIKYSPTKEAVKRAINFVNSERGSLNKDLKVESICKYVIKNNGEISIEDIKWIGRYIKKKNIHQFLKNWISIQGKPLNRADTDKKNIFEYSEVYIDDACVYFKIDDLYYEMSREKWEMAPLEPTVNGDKVKYNKEQLGSILQTMKGHIEAEAYLRNDETIRVRFYNEEEKRWRYNKPYLHKFNLNKDSFTDDQIFKFFDKDLSVGETTIKEVTHFISQEVSLLKDILAGEKASGSRTNLSHDQIYYFLDNYENMSFRAMARAFLEDSRYELNKDSEEAILGKIKRVNKRFSEKEIYKALNKAIKTNQIKSTNGKTLKKPFVHKSIKGLDKIKILSKQ